jgi:hypothetical protein
MRKKPVMHSSLSEDIMSWLSWLSQWKTMRQAVLLLLCLHYQRLVSQSRRPGPQNHHHRRQGLSQIRPGHRHRRQYACRV